MKECPICHTKYDDSVNFCTNDGRSLIDTTGARENKLQTTDSNLQNASSKTNTGGCIKKIVIGVVVIVVGLVLLYNHIVNATTYLRTEPDMITVSKRGGESKIDIDYDGYVWTINHKPDWVNVEEEEDNFNLQISANKTGQPLEGTITVQSGKQLAQVIIRQNAYATVLRTSDTSLKFDVSGGSRDIKIDTDGCEWETESPDWLSVTKQDEGKIHIACRGNSDEYRTGTIILKEDNLRTIISVTQSGKCNNCHGSGQVTCTICHGAGGSGYGMYYVNCIWCGGQGHYQCGSCGGRGTRE